MSTTKTDVETSVQSRQKVEHKSYDSYLAKGNVTILQNR